jgi:hypothetical protein
MPFIGTATGSFTAGRRANAFSAPPASSWDPSTDITTAFWLDGSDTGSYTTSGSTVTSVTDKSGNFSSITVNGTPINSTTLNSLNTFTFASGSLEDFTTDTEETIASSGNHWAIGVYQWNSINDTQDTFWSTENNTVAGTSKRDYAVSAGNASAFNGELDLDGLASNRISSTIGNLQAFDSGIAQNTWVILGVWFDKTGNQIGARVNGTNAFTPVNDYDNSINSSADVRILRNRANERMSGRMAEFFMVAARPGSVIDPLEDFEKAEGYLAHKWALTGGLPGGHPYKTVAP